MEKTAHDYYAEGVLSALQNTNASDTIKVAAFNYVKEAGLVGKLLDKADKAQKGVNLSNPKGSKVLDLILGKRRKSGLRLDNAVTERGNNKGVLVSDITRYNNTDHHLADLAERQRRAMIGLGATGLGAAGLTTGAAGLAGAFDGPEPEGWDSLTPAQQAAIVGGGAAAVGGAGYGLSQLM